MPTYKRAYNGRGIVADFRRLLETGDMAKLTPRLYHCLTQSGGFIAHFSLDGFRQTFNGRLGEMLAGEFYPLDDPECWTLERKQHLEDSIYKDGMTAGEVMRAIAKIGAEQAWSVRTREAAQRRMAEVAYVAQRYGITTDAAAELVDNKPHLIA